MLNELLLIDRGLQTADIQFSLTHKDVKEASRVPTLWVLLDSQGLVSSARLVPPDVTPWTLRDGQHNSFPFVRLDSAIVDTGAVDATKREAIMKAEIPERRRLLLDATRNAPVALELKTWPKPSFVRRLDERLDQLRRGGAAPALVDVFRRFLRACQEPAVLLANVLSAYLGALDRFPDKEWTDAGVALVLGKWNSKKSQFAPDGALLFDSSDNPMLPIYSAEMRVDLSRALLQAERSEGSADTAGVCALTGHKTRLLEGSFPQPNLPIVGQTFLFARNPDTPSNDRYRRSAADTMPVGEEVAMQLAAAFETVTAEERKGITWRSIPGEAPKQTDLFVAFVERRPDVAVAGELTGDDEEVASKTLFELRTRRLVQAFEAAEDSDFGTAPVRFVIIRKVDTANRKVVHHSVSTVSQIQKAAKEWIAGERNLPPWLKLPVLVNKSRPVHLGVWHVPPLAMPALTRRQYIRGGEESQQVRGAPASETLALFLSPSESREARAVAKRLLALFVHRSGVFLSSVGHDIRHPSEKTTSKGLDALKVLSALGVLLLKVNRTSEVYMTDVGFRLGQVLAAADTVHAGYCADVRDGKLPSSLLGNQFIVMAQRRPASALAALCRRWKPYAGWARTPLRDRIEKLKNGNADEKQRAWAIIAALRDAREVGAIAAELTGTLNDAHPDDAFRAELLLGYLAGLPKVVKETPNVEGESNE